MTIRSRYRVRACLPFMTPLVLLSILIGCNSQVHERVVPRIERRHELTELGFKIIPNLKQNADIEPVWLQAKNEQLVSSSESTRLVLTTDRNLESATGKAILLLQEDSKNAFDSGQDWREIPIIVNVHAIPRQENQFEVLVLYMDYQIKYFEMDARQARQLLAIHRLVDCHSFLEEHRAAYINEVMNP